MQTSPSEIWRERSAKGGGDQWYNSTYRRTIFYFLRILPLVLHVMSREMYTHKRGCVSSRKTSQRGKRKNYWKKYEGRLWNVFFFLSREHFWTGCRPSVPYIQQPAMEELRCSPSPPPSFHTGLRTCRINICRGKKTENCVGFPSTQYAGAGI